MEGLTRGYRRFSVDNSSHVEMPGAERGFKKL